MHQDLDVVHVNINGIYTRSVEILTALLLSHQMKVGESNEKLISPRMPCNHTHCVVVFTAPLYSDSADERDIVCCFIIHQNMGPCTRINT